MRFIFKMNNLYQPLKLLSKHNVYQTFSKKQLAEFLGTDDSTSIDGTLNANILELTSDPDIQLYGK